MLALDVMLYCPTLTDPDPERLGLRASNPKTTPPEWPSLRVTVCKPATVCVTDVLEVVALPIYPSVLDPARYAAVKL